MAQEKQLMAEKMRELSASSQYRKCISEMNKLQRCFSNRRFVTISNNMPENIRNKINDLLKKVSV